MGTECVLGEGEGRYHPVKYDGGAPSFMGWLVPT